MATLNAGEYEFRSFVASTLVPPCFLRERATLAFRFVSPDGLTSIFRAELDNSDPSVVPVYFCKRQLSDVEAKNIRVPELGWLTEGCFLSVAA